MFSVLVILLFTSGLMLQSREKQGKGREKQGKGRENQGKGRENQGNAQ